MTGHRGDHKHVPGSTNEGAGEVGHDDALTRQQQSELQRDDKREPEGAIPDEARDDFTFPDENGSLGRRTGDDLPGESGEDRR